MNGTTPLLQLVDVVKRFGSLNAVDNVSLDVEAGKVTCIVGPSGSGKSTLLRTVNMLEEIDGGAIFFDGEMIHHHLRNGHRVPVSAAVARRQALNFGTVFQHFNLFPNYSALGNVAIALRLSKGMDRREAEKRARHHLTRVGLGAKVDHYPNQLSGGQQQRVAIARAVALEPRMLLFDEPTSALDPELVGEVLTVMRDLAELGSTMLVVTHEMRFAEDVADELIMMDAGKIIEQGTPSTVLHSPSTDRARKFFASVGKR
jgi:polar amino acid transport system ATP-binding protein